MSLWIVTSVAVQLLSPGAAAADSIRDAQWHLPFLRISETHSISLGDRVTVAVVDTGVDASHPDLANAVGSGSVVNGVGDGRTDSNGHGTSMAGLIAARGQQDVVGALGVAPRAVIIPIAIPDYGPSSVSAGIDQAVVMGAKIICLALTSSDDRLLETAIQRALQEDIVVVAGVGNRPSVGVQVPANYAGVVAAVGIDQAGNHADISVAGPEAMLAAPAVDIVSTDRARGYAKGTGTSASTAIIAGVAALVRSRFPELKATEVVHRMTATAIDRGPPGRDREYGFGIVNPVAALTADVPPLSAELSPSPSRAVGQSDPPAGGAGGLGALVAALVVVAGLATVVGAVVLLSRRAR
ncbi:S8 family serine peptidase [Virgisporangium ochraceum]|nr:S8 family serine peptidase [Virgisporangium ochraceum]